MGTRDVSHDGHSDWLKEPSDRWSQMAPPVFAEYVQLTLPLSRWSHRDEGGIFSQGISPARKSPTVPVTFRPRERDVISHDSGRCWNFE
jgi:hypothetical protein